MAPLPGMRVIGEYPTRFAADLAAAQLLESGLESTVLSANWSPPYDVVERSFRLVVRDEVAAHANDVLTGGVPRDHEAESLDAQYHLRRFADRPAWVRWATWTALVVVAGPVVLLAAYEAVFLFDRLFP